MTRFRFLLCILWSLLLFVPAQASDIAKEKRWAEQIVDSIMVGEDVWLSAGRQKFLGIYTGNNADRELGGAIIIHGIGVHPNWQSVVHPLRTELPEQGWHTLSLQMPILANEKEVEDYAPLFSEVAPRLDAAVAFLKERGVKKIVIVAHSLGASMAAHYLASKPRAEIAAFVVIGVSGHILAEQKVSYLDSLPRLGLPVLDLYGSDDLETVRKSAHERQALAKQSAHKDYTQIKVDGANHFFAKKNEALVGTVSNWLQKH